MAGLSVAVVALPLAMAFGIGSGAGAAAGLYAAIFAGFVTSLFGGSEYQISGPTGAMTVILVDVVSRYGVEGMLLAGAMAGVLQILLGLFRLGRFVKYLPQPVISGFTTGIATLLFLSQLEAAGQEPLIALVTVGVMLLAKRVKTPIPASLWGLGAAVLVNELFIHTPHLVGAIPAGLPRPSLPLDQLGAVGELMGPAISICLLGSIEALLSAEVADFMTGTRHDGNRELIGQGLGNLTAALVGGVPVTGAIARTAVNAKSGAHTRLSGMVHSVVLLIIMVLLGPWAARIPLAALAGILMVTAVGMVDLEGLRLLPRTRWTYGATLGLTLVLTVLQDLTVAVAGGLALAALFTVAELASPWLETPRSGTVPALPRPVVPRHPDVQLIILRGPLFFVGVEKLRRQVEQVTKPVLVLDLAAVTAVDESGLLMLKRLAQDLERSGKSLYIAGVRGPLFRRMARLGVLDDLCRHRVGRSLKAVLRRAEAEAARGQDEDAREPVAFPGAAPLQERA